MSCKSAIYTADPSSTVLTLSTAAGTAIPLGMTVRRFGCNAVLSGNGILLKGQGYFDVDASVTFTPTAAGTYTVTLFKDGVAVPGATQTITVAAAGTVWTMLHSWAYSITTCRVSKPYARRNTTQSCRRSTRCSRHYLSNSVKHLSHT